MAPSFIHDMGANMVDRIRMYIDGEWIESASGRTTTIINPANGTVAAEATQGTAGEADMAVAAARKAFEPDRRGVISPPTNVPSL
ncbi:aldehyde dehydrogenase family protein [Bifidobacterium callitrichidarum]|uniref:Aldehyde dehydrogenase domain-containing protein n=1 Tax=Bifidobacterium callitrichidarum TaxID=2052941 RepID=A0A2U2MZF5_9BIFI|nr:aldehyde dehydrogenase family protein [Bifidobacterium callitrichidarum]PWG62183.1 hypothetical protein DF196_12475 [Bifidobacterium callitrichidarum]